MEFQFILPAAENEIYTQTSFNRSMGALVKIPGLGEGRITFASIIRNGQAAIITVEFPNDFTITNDGQGFSIERNDDGGG